MMQGGYTPEQVNSINNFAQSISYRFSEKQKVGFEIGFNEYTYGRFQRVIVPFANLDGVEFNPAAGDRYTRNGISTMIESNITDRTYWGVLFTERKLVDYDIVNFSGRIGFGAANSGPLAYGRLLGNLRLFNNISLTAGLDMRLFQANLSNFVDQTNGFKNKTNPFLDFSSSSI
jgi:hypothetical protein